MEFIIIIFLVFNSWVLGRRVKELQKDAKSQNELLSVFDGQVQELKKFIRFQHKTNTNLSEKNRLLRLQHEPISPDELENDVFSRRN